VSAGIVRHKHLGQRRNLEAVLPLSQKLLDGWKQLVDMIG